MFDSKKQLLWSKMRVGIVITIAAVIIFFTVFFAGTIENIFSPRVEFKAQVQDAKGLRTGAPVWISGIEVGSVSDISLHPSLRTVITLSVDKKAFTYIRKDSQASILTMGLLGDKYIEISTGTAGAEALSPGGVILGSAQIDLKDVMETGTTSIQKMNEFIEKLGRIVEQIEKGEGTVTKLLTDPSLYDNLKDSSKELSAVLRDVRKGEGSLGALIKDPSIYENLRASSSSLAQFSIKLNEGSGTLRRLAEDPALYEKMVLISTSLEEFTGKLNREKGSLNRLIEDPSLYENMSRASERLTVILDRIERGEGTAGLLVRNEEMAGELRATVAELRKLIAEMRENPRKFFKFSIL